MWVMRPLAGPARREHYSHMRLLILTLVLASCEADRNPSATYEIRPVDPSDPDVARYLEGARTWSDLGVEEQAGSPTVIWFVRDPHLVEHTGHRAMTDRAARLVTIDARVAGFDLLVASAHEVGHVVLDTGEHTSCGVMGGYDVALCDEDVALACRAAGLGCPE